MEVHEVGRPRGRLVLADAGNDGDVLAGIRPVRKLVLGSNLSGMCLLFRCPDLGDVCQKTVALVLLCAPISFHYFEA